MFEKTLQDMVKDIRSQSQSKPALERYVSGELQKIKGELKKADSSIKSNAVAKLTYLKIVIQYISCCIILVSTSIN